MSCEWLDKIFTVDKEGFSDLTLEIFQFQCQHNPVYKQFTEGLKIDPTAIKSVEQIPFLQIRFFKSHEIKTTDFIPEVVFESSGTTQSINSRHFVKEKGLYEKSFMDGFENVYGSVKKWCII